MRDMKVLTLGRLAVSGKKMMEVVRFVFEIFSCRPLTDGAI